MITKEQVIEILRAAAEKDFAFFDENYSTRPADGFSHVIYDGSINPEFVAEKIAETLQESHVNAWQTMDSAERTGKKTVLLALPNGTTHEGYWGAGPYDRKLRDYVFGWVLSPNSGLVKPTYWMPMPIVPSVVVESEE